MVRPETLDRVENGGSGSDINPSERNPKEATLENPALFRTVIIQPAAVLEAVKARPGKVGVCLYGRATADLDSFEHGGRLDDHGPEERSVCRVWAPLVFARVD